MSKLPISEVYRIIDGELIYQLDKYGADEPSIERFCTMLLEYIEEAEVDLLGRAEHPNDFLEAVRKIAAIAAHCMEVHGAPERKPK